MKSYLGAVQLKVSLGILWHCAVEKDPFVSLCMGNMTYIQHLSLWALNEVHFGKSAGVLKKTM